MEYTIHDKELRETKEKLEEVEAKLDLDSCIRIFFHCLYFESGFICFPILEFSIMLYVTSSAKFFNLILNIEIVQKIGLQNFGAILLYIYDILENYNIGVFSIFIQMLAAAIL